MASDYTTWTSLTDRSFTGRHLPPDEPRKHPAQEELLALYRRDTEIKSTDTSVLFAFFAQWFTDSFLRTSVQDYPRKNSSTQEIDLCQIYGLSAEKTEMLRSDIGGRLKSQLIAGEEYPQYLFEPGGGRTVKPEFEGLHKQESLDLFIKQEPPEHIFAVGLEYGNSTIGHTILNTVFLREHNRIAQLLDANKPEWKHDNDRLFETTRNIMIVQLLKLVIEEYIRHIAPFDFPIEAVPFIADGERWNRSNWVSIEFNLLYRWHSLVPDEIDIGTDHPLKAENLRENNRLVLERGIESLVSHVSCERAGKLGLHNTTKILYESVETRTIDMMRKSRLRPFNDYREAFGLKRLAGFEDLTTDAALRSKLEELYTDIDDLEWYVGIFAEDYPDYRMMGSLMTTMVAYDAFTQALTNPLLARNVYNEATFTKVGMQIINDTHCLQQIIARNSKSPADVYASFRCE